MVKCHHMIPFALMVGAIIMIALLLRIVMVVSLAVKPFAKYLSGETHAVAISATIIFATAISLIISTRVVENRPKIFPHRTIIGQ